MVFVSLITDTARTSLFFPYRPHTHRRTCSDFPSPPTLRLGSRRRSRGAPRCWLTTLALSDRLPNPKTKASCTWGGVCNGKRRLEPAGLYPQACHRVSPPPAAGGRRGSPGKARHIDSPRKKSDVRKRDQQTSTSGLTAPERAPTRRQKSAGSHASGAFLAIARKPR